MKKYTVSLATILILISSQSFAREFYKIKFHLEITHSNLSKSDAFIAKTSGQFIISDDNALCELHLKDKTILPCEVKDAQYKRDYDVSAGISIIDMAALIDPLLKENHEDLRERFGRSYNENREYLLGAKWGTNIIFGKRTKSTYQFHSEDKHESMHVTIKLGGLRGLVSI